MLILPTRSSLEYMNREKLPYKCNHITALLKAKVEKSKHLQTSMQL